MKKYFANKKCAAGTFILFPILVFVIAGLFYTPYNPVSIDISCRLEFFSREHWLGTDNLGRDIASRVLYGHRLSFFMGSISSLFGLVAGSFIGIAGGYFGGVLDEAVRKVIDVMMAFPGILLALLFVSVMGAGNQTTAIALCVMSVPRFARITRGSCIKLRASFMVLSLKVRGATSARIILMHILPNMYSELLVTFMINFNYAVMSEAGLSYLGLGVQPPFPSFGRMLNEGQGQIFSAPWVVLVPVAAFVLPIIGLMLLCDGIESVNKDVR